MNFKIIKSFYNLFNIYIDTGEPDINENKHALIALILPFNFSLIQMNSNSFYYYLFFGIFIIWLFFYISLFIIYLYNYYTIIAKQPLIFIHHFCVYSLFPFVLFLLVFIFYNYPINSYKQLVFITFLSFWFSGSTTKLYDFKTDNDKQ